MTLTSIRNLKCIHVIVKFSFAHQFRQPDKESDLILLRVYDHNKKSKKHDLIGELELPVAKFKDKSVEEWYRWKKRKGSAMNDGQGEVHYHINSPLIIGQDPLKSRVWKSSTTITSTSISTILSTSSTQQSTYLYFLWYLLTLVAMMVQPPLVYSGGYMQPYVQPYQYTVPMNPMYPYAQPPPYPYPTQAPPYVNGTYSFQWYN